MKRSLDNRLPESTDKILESGSNFGIGDLLTGFVDLNVVIIADVIVVVDVFGGLHGLQKLEPSLIGQTGLDLKSLAFPSKTFESPI
jgi:hypothetical protein